MKQVLCLLCVFCFMVQPIRAQTNIFPPNGSVGVGTVSPAYKLHVYDASDDVHLVASTAATGKSGIFYVENSANSAYGYLSAYGSTYPGTHFGFNRAGSSGLLLSPVTLGIVGTLLSTDLAFGTNSAENMRIKVGGNVGIGTTSPGYKLHVYDAVNDAPIVASSVATGKAGILYTENTGNGANAYISSYGSAYTGTHFGINRAGSSGLLLSPATIGIVGTLLSTDLVFGTNNVENMRIKVGGNIGIGTSSPDEKLSVEGNIIADGVITARKIKVTQTGWSDYVFEPAYKLMPLSELETFIAKHKHLPDIPTAKEVAEKGISVGDNQSLLLKKIEELTLYMIELKKENIQIKAQLDQLVKKSNR